MIIIIYVPTLIYNTKIMGVVYSTDIIAADYLELASKKEVLLSGAASVKELHEGCWSTYVS